MGKTTQVETKNHGFVHFWTYHVLFCGELGICFSSNDSTEYRITYICPTRLMKYGRLALSSPRDPSALLQARYRLYPCTICSTSRWDHLDEKPIPFHQYKASCDQVMECHSGTRQSDHANAEGNPICDAQQIVAELPDISLETRNDFLKKVGSNSAGALNAHIFQELNSI